MRDFCYLFEPRRTQENPKKYRFLQLHWNGLVCIWFEIYTIASNNCIYEYHVHHTLISNTLTTCAGGTVQINANASKSFSRLITHNKFGFLINSLLGVFLENDLKIFCSNSINFRLFYCIILFVKLYSIRKRT